ncbi:hypothetical protein FNAPI_8530 [Fusarium napiforme]|uniref:Uncharacterized protein n=1 Tax=Fusarium napiforme TaxID=42672 RepID=A0A8H5J6S0_9HYPO|nr:hypothetical protein FNAPI_8530 [Fusarium napiforme]
MQFLKPGLASQQRQRRYTNTKPTDVHRTFCNGKATWQAFLDRASKMPSGLWPADTLDPYITLTDVPSMPEQLPRRDWLYGRPCWELPFDIAVRLLKMQGQEVQFTIDRLWPDTSQRQIEQEIHLNLKGASPSLIQWLCAILSPKIGWQANDQGQLPPWANSLTTEVKLNIKAPTPAIDIRLPPRSSEATELLIELCRIFDLGAEAADASGLEPLPPYKASFLATLVLPFYNFTKLQPRFPPPHLTRPQRFGIFRSSYEQNIREYFNDMRYFMTLSIHPL